MAQINEQNLEKLLAEYASSLGITDEQRRLAERKYKEIGEWLQSGQFFKEYKPDVYPQGSFALGTVVRPVKGDCFDLDIVVELTRGEILHSSKEIKQAVNERLKEDKEGNPCLNADKQVWPMCYTLSFPKQFDMDIVPARYGDSDRITYLKNVYPDKSRFFDTAIKVVDRNDQWIESNPRGFIRWFDEISKRSKHKDVIHVMDELHALPAYQVNSPLQNMVQILKKHATEMFDSEEIRDYKPASIAITTLAALSFKKEYSLYGALKNFKDNALKILGDKLELENPANPGEYFSQNWENDPQKKKWLLKWLENVDSFIKHLIELDESTSTVGLDESFERAKTSQYESYLESQNLPSSYAHANEAEETHLSKLLTYRTKIIPEVERKKFGIYHADKAKNVAEWESFYKTKIPLQHEAWLKFSLKTDCPVPYTVCWQVVNAPYCEEPRGEVIQEEVTNNSKPLVRYELTKWFGNHYIKCFILKNNKIVGEDMVWVPIAK